VVFLLRNRQIIGPVFATSTKAWRVKQLNGFSASWRGKKNVYLEICLGKKLDGQKKYIIVVHKEVSNYENIKKFGSKKCLSGTL
jgi:hypothetical protein